MISSAMRLAAERLLAESLSSTPQIRAIESIGHEEHTAVLRIHLDRAAVPSVVLKRAVRTEGDAFNPDDPEYGDAAARLWNEWAGLEFLSRPPAAGVTPRFLGADRHLGFVLLEDLGDGPSLATLLLGSDQDAAVRTLYGYGAALAAVHAATFGRVVEYEDLRGAHGPLAPRAPRLIGFAWDRIVALLGTLDDGFTVSPEATDAVRRVDARVADAGPFLAYSPGDCCPDNNCVAADGNVRLFDLECGGFHHALLDVAYLHSTMPTCWCVRRIPATLAEGVVDRYKKLVLASNPPGRDAIEERFDSDLAACRSQWALRAAAGHLVRLHEDDDDPGPYWDAWRFQFRSSRQLLVFRLEQLAEACRPHQELEPLVELATAVQGLIVKRWGPTEPMDLYPALAGPITP